jgi:copper homeostasis protein
MAPVLEICCYSPTAAKIAQQAGAHRIELCDNPGEGGTTPSYGVLKWVRENVSIPVFPIIRPRGGHFVFTREEIQIMESDISLYKSMGFDGVVIGLLTPDGEVDYRETARLTELSWPMEVTFHRAFDRVKNPFKALNTIIKAGCQRILSSGQKPTAPEGSDLLKELVMAAGDSIIIMPGAGIRSSNIENLARNTGANEFHSSAGVIISEPFFSPKTLQEQLEQYLPDNQEIGLLLQSLAKLSVGSENY